MCLFWFEILFLWLPEIQESDQELQVSVPYFLQTDQLNQAAEKIFLRVIFAPQILILVPFFVSYFVTLWRVSRAPEQASKLKAYVIKLN